jgi:glycosyltransferase involved in cell wall biosynthesis
MLHHLRAWDRDAASRVDYFLANSTATQRRIQKYYGRPAHVLRPPVDVSSFHIADRVGDGFLIVSGLQPYKRIDIAVDAFNRLGLPLEIIGTGPELGRLKAMARPNITFLGWRPDCEVREAYARCRAFIMTAEEDFGLTPLEANASGRPVIAYGKGGALETVRDGVTGVLFPEQSVDALVAAVRHFDAARFDPRTLRDHACQFDVPVFARGLQSFVHDCLSAYRERYGLAS